MKGGGGGKHGRKKKGGSSHGESLSSLKTQRTPDRRQRKKRSNATGVLQKNLTASNICRGRKRTKHKERGVAQDGKV